MQTESFPIQNENVGNIFFFKNTKCEERIFFFIRIPRGDNELAGAFVVFSSF